MQTGMGEEIDTQSEILAITNADIPIVDIIEIESEIFNRCPVG